METLATAPPLARAGVVADTVSALDRGLQVLACFREGQLSLSSTELARLTGIPRPTVTRLAATLAHNGWLRQDAETERFTLGAGALVLARAFLSGYDARASAREPMQALADVTGGSVYLAVCDGMEMVLIEACRPRSRMFTARLSVGSRVPLANSALGRAYLCALGPEARAPLVESLRLMRGNEWPALEESFTQSQKDWSSTGVCLSLGHFHSEINSAAIAVRGPDGELLVLNCGGPAHVFDEARLRQQITPELQKLARTLAKATGGEAMIPGDIE